MKTGMITYQIIMEPDGAVLYSVTETRFGGPATNYVARGTYGKMRVLKEKLEQCEKTA